MLAELDLVLFSPDIPYTQQHLNMNPTLRSGLAISRFRGSVLGTVLSIMQMPSYLRPNLTLGPSIETMLSLDCITQTETQILSLTLHSAHT